MKTISIRQLHEKTGEYVRKVAEVGEIYVTDHDRTVAKIIPQADSCVSQAHGTWQAEGWQG